jgi:malonyl-ACP decarboxylase
VGGASASGLLAIIQAAQAVVSGQVDVCLAVGPLMDISHWEIQAFRNIGAMGSDKFSAEPAMAARPFDASHDGFIFGENCGVVVIERMSTALTRDCFPYARLTGWGMAVDGNRQPNPSLAGEISVIQSALKRADLSAKDIDYVNPHGTGSLIGDATELSALRHCQLNNARINATKSLIGHGLTAAGMVEVIATLLQMKAGQLHPTRNLVEPIDESFEWVRNQAEKCDIRNALKLSMGFGGINTAICLSTVQ